MADTQKTEPTRGLRLLLDEQERERSDLAHRLHDGLAQSLAVVLFELDALVQSASGDEDSRLAGLREQLSAALRLCTELAVGLRPPVLDQLGLAPALESLAERLGAKCVGLDSGLAAAGLGAHLETDVYRTVEEALGAAGPGSRLTISLDPIARELCVVVEALDVATPIGGLGRVQARVELVGGMLVAGGRELTIRIPVPVRTAARSRLSRNSDAWRPPMASRGGCHSVGA